MLPAWCDNRVPVFDFELQGETPSNNVIKGMHYRSYRTLRRQWQLKVFCEGLKGRRPAQCVARTALVIDRYCAGELDWDNAYGGLKPLLDCLVAPSKQNPDGLGLILNDNPTAMPFPPLLYQLRAPRGEGRTRIRIFDLDAAILMVAIQP